jgi:hypothetical protein
VNFPLRYTQGIQIANGNWQSAKSYFECSAEKEKREGTGWIFIQKRRKLGLRFINQINSVKF